MKYFAKTTFNQPHYNYNPRKPFIGKTVISIRRALALSFIERYLLIILAVASNMILARILTPEEIGIYSVSLAVIGIAQVMRDFGIGNFLIQEPVLNQDHIRSAFGISILFGAFLFLIVAISAPLAGDFYNDKRIVDTIRINALNFLTLPFCSISMALLRREMQFKKLLYINIFATTVGVIATIWLANAKYGQNSIAIGTIISNILTGFGAWFAHNRNVILPGFSEWRALTKFGYKSLATNTVTTISMNINDLAIGKLIGFGEVAIISRAQGLMNLFHRDLMNAVRNVALPGFAREHREKKPLELHFQKSVIAITDCAWPFYGFIALFSLEILRLMFGTQWDRANDLIPIFCVAGAVAATANLITTLLTALGRIDLVMKAEFIFQPFRAILITLVAIIYQSIYACAIAYTIAFVFYAPLMYYVKQKILPTNFTDLRNSLVKSFLNAIITLAIPISISFYSGINRTVPIEWWLFGVACLATLLIWIIALNMTSSPISNDPIFRKIFKKKIDRYK